jgi:hypothetical protein
VLDLEPTTNRLVRLPKGSKAQSKSAREPGERVHETGSGMKGPAWVGLGKVWNRKVWLEVQVLHTGEKSYLSPLG